MKQLFLLSLLCFALLPSSVSANYEEMVKVVDETFVSQVAGSKETDFVDEAGLAPLTTANFPKSKEETAGGFETTEPPKGGKITTVHKLKKRCLVFDKPNLFEPVFCYEIWIKPATQLGPSSGNANAKMFTVLVYLTNSVVTSRIKITLASGSGNQTIRRILTRGIVTFLAKADQTLSTLKTFTPQLKETLPKLLGDIGTIIGRDKGPVKFGTMFFNPVTGLHTQSDFTTKPLVDGEGDSPKLDEKADENAPLLKLFEDVKAQSKFVPKEGAPGVPAEFLAVKIHQEVADGEFNQMFADYVKQLFLVVANIEGRLSVHIRSDIFSFSKSLPVASRPILLHTIQHLVEKALVETYLTFYILDMPRPEGLPEDVNLQWFRSLMEGLDAPLPFKEEVAGSNEFIADFMNYKIQVRGYLIKGHEDFLVRVLLNRESEVVLDRMSYFPLKSQYILAPLIQSYIQGVCREYYETIYAGMVIPGPSQKESNEVSAVFGKVIIKRLKAWYTIKMQLAAYLAGSRNIPFIPEAATQLVLDNSLKAAELALKEGKEAKVVAYNLLGSPDHDKQKGLVMKVKQVKTTEFETTQVSQVEANIMKANGIEVSKTVTSKLQQYEVVRNTGQTFIYEQTQVD